MTYRMFIDDERMPPDGEWVIVRSVLEAQDYITVHGMPNYVSFDHDLGSLDGYPLPTGYDFALWLTQQDLDHNSLPQDFDFYVHSQNPIGKENIISLLDNYLEFKHEYL